MPKKKYLFPVIRPTHSVYSRVDFFMHSFEEEGHIALQLSVGQ
jgi:hypothetical protein